MVRQILLTLSLGFLVAFLFFSPVKIFAADPNTLLSEVNQFRASNGLLAVKSDPQTCGFATLRADEITSQFNHSGFYDRVKNKSLPYNHYKLVTENLAKAPGSLDPVQMWINSPSHRANLLRNTSYACIIRQGDYYTYEGLST